MLAKRNFGRLRAFVGYWWTSRSPKSILVQNQFPMLLEGRPYGQIFIVIVQVVPSWSYGAGGRVVVVCCRWSGRLNMDKVHSVKIL